MSKHNPVTKAINYMLDEKGRWEAFTTFLEDGRLCLTNNAAERALRGIALGRKSWLFAGSERGGDRAAFMYTLIVTAKMNDIDPQASALYSWHSKDERFGVLIGVTQQKRTTRTMEASTEDYQWYGDGTTARDANGGLLPQDGIHYWWGQSGFNNQTGGNYSEFFMPTSVNFAVKDEKRIPVDGALCVTRTRDGGQSFETLREGRKFVCHQIMEAMAGHNPEDDRFRRTRGTVKLVAHRGTSQQFSHKGIDNQTCFFGYYFFEAFCL